MRVLWALLLVLSLSLSAAAQEYSAGRGPNYDPRSGVGSFDLILYVDGEVLLYVQEGRIRTQILSGNPTEEAGSNFTQPIPKAVFGDFRMEKITGRGVVTLPEGPTA